MKNRGLIITLIILLAICSVLLTGILVLGLSGKYSSNSLNIFRKYKVSNELILDETYTDNYSNIRIKTNAANIEIKHGSETHLVVHGKKEYLTVSNLEKELEIEYKNEPCRFFCINYAVSKIELYLSDEYAGKINIDNDYGDIEIDEYLKSDVEIKSSFGDTIIKGANKATVKSAAGDVKLGEVNIAEIDNNYGDIKIDKINKKATINDDCGDIKIKDLFIEENSSINNNLGDINVNHTNDIRIDADTSLGDKKVNNNNYKSDIVLKISNSCGDIEVN